MINQPIDQRIKRFLVPMLRKQWLYWPARQEAIKRAMVDRGNYKCEMCGQSGFKRNELQVDHIEPVQTLETKLVSWYDLIMFITRLFVEADKLQALDKQCHQIKSNLETKMRKHYRDEAKKSQNGKNSLDKDKK